MPQRTLRARKGSNGRFAPAPDSPRRRGDAEEKQGAIPSSISIEVTRDAGLIEAMLEEPELRAPLEAAGFVPNGEQIAKLMAGPHLFLVVAKAVAPGAPGRVYAGFFILLARGQGVFEAHMSLALHGAEALAACELARDYMFLATPCLVLTTSYGPADKTSGMMARWSGQSQDGAEPEGTTWLSQHIFEWARHAKEEHEDSGAWFREELHALRGAPPWPPSRHRDQIAGLALVIATRHQQPFKATEVFNLLGTMASLPPLQMLEVGEDGARLRIAGEMLFVTWDGKISKG